MLKNMEERKAYVNDYKTWGIFADVPKLSMRVYRKELPDGSSIYATEFMARASYPSKEYKWGSAHFQLVEKDGHYKPVWDSISTIIEHMMRIKVDKKDAGN